MESTKKANGVRYIDPARINIYTDENGRPLNPRGPVRDTTDLQASVAVAGIITPLLLREDEKGGYWVIEGHRRLVAALIKKLPVVPYVTLQGDLDPVEAMLASHVQEDFPVIVLNGNGDVVGGIALAVHRQLASANRTLESLARLMGEKSTDKISAYNQLVTAPEDVQRSVAEGKTSITAFRRMKFAPPKLQSEIVGSAEDGDVTLALVRKKLKEAKERQEQEMETGEHEGASGGAIETLNQILGSLRELVLNLDSGAITSVREQAVLGAISIEVQRLKGGNENAE